jgi:hypothetical protein
MTALAAPPQSPDDTRHWSPSMVEGLPSRMPPQDPVQLLLAEQQRDQSRLRLVLCATASVLILAVAGTLLG